MEFTPTAECTQFAAEMPLCTTADMSILPPCFRREIPAWICFVNAQDVTQFLGAYKQFVLRRQLPFGPGVVSIQDLRAILKDCGAQFDNFPEDASTKAVVCSEELQEYPGVQHKVILRISLDWLSRQQKLQLVLEKSAIPTAFETAGHLAHYNLQDEAQLRVRRYIGLCTLDKNIRTVVTKTDSLQGEFRALPMELIAGEADFVVSVKQQGFVFKVDLSKCYWNSRLEREHGTVLKKIVQLSKDAVKSDQGHAPFVLDATAGVGPFAVPLGAARVRVEANDLNPASAELLKVNCQANKIKDVTVHCDDGLKLLHLTLSKPGCFAVILNLPERSVDFLLAYRGVERPASRPVFFIETFTRSEELFEVEIPLRAIAARFGWTIVNKLVGASFVKSITEHTEFLAGEFGCDNINYDQLRECMRTESTSNKIKQLIVDMFEKLEVRAVRDVGTAKWMVCAELQFHEMAGEHAEIKRDML